MAEANRDAAHEALTRALNAAHDQDHHTAMRLVRKSLALFRTDEAERLEHRLRKFGPGSDAAAAVQRVAAAHDHYAVLNLPSASNKLAQPELEKLVAKAFKDLSRVLHPDKNMAVGAAAAMQRLNAAREVLSDAVKRRDYDLSHGQKPAAAPPRAAAGRKRPFSGVPGNGGNPPNAGERWGGTGASSSAHGGSAAGGGNGTTYAEYQRRIEELTAINNHLHAQQTASVKVKRELTERMKELATTRRVAEAKQRELDESNKSWTKMAASWREREDSLIRSLASAREEAERLERGARLDRLELERLRPKCDGLFRANASLSAKVESLEAALGEARRMYDEVRQCRGQKAAAAAAPDSVLGMTADLSGMLRASIAKTDTASGGPDGSSEATSRARMAPIDAPATRLATHAGLVSPSASATPESCAAAAAAAAEHAQTGVAAANAAVGDAPTAEPPSPAAPVSALAQSQQPPLTVVLLPRATDAYPSQRSEEDPNSHDEPKPVALRLAAGEHTILGRKSNSKRNVEDYGLRDQRISRSHLRLEAAPSGVRALATSLGANPFSVFRGDEPEHEVTKGERITLEPGDVLRIVGCTSALTTMPDASPGTEYLVHYSAATGEVALADARAKLARLHGGSPALAQAPDADTKPTDAPSEPSSSVPTRAFGNVPLSVQESRKRTREDSVDQEGEHDVKPLAPNPAQWTGLNGISLGLALHKGPAVSGL